MITLQEAYNILKANAHYSSGQCEGFVYLSQIEELLEDEWVEQIVCDDCNGTGSVMESQYEVDCYKCRGTGKIEK